MRTQNLTEGGTITSGTDGAAWLSENPVYTIGSQHDLLRFTRERHRLAESSGDLAAAIAIQAFETRELIDRLTLLLNRDGATSDGLNALELLDINGDLAACYGDDLQGMPAHVFEEIWRATVNYAAEAKDVTLSHVKALGALIRIATVRGWPDDTLMNARFARAWANLASRTPGDVRDDGSVSGYMGMVQLPKLPPHLQQSAVQILKDARP